jgi:hypothetical protein
MSMLNAKGKRRGGLLQELLVEASKLAVPVGLLIANEGARLLKSKKSKVQRRAQGGRRLVRRPSARQSRQSARRSGTRSRSMRRSGKRRQRGGG